MNFAVGRHYHLPTVADLSAGVHPTYEWKPQPDVVLPEPFSVARHDPAAVPQSTPAWRRPNRCVLLTFPCYNSIPLCCVPCSYTAAWKQRRYSPELYRDTPPCAFVPRNSFCAMVLCCALPRQCAMAVKSLRARSCCFAPRCYAVVCC